MNSRGPVEFCTKKHKVNNTLAYHQCMCNYDYSYVRTQYKSLKLRHCHEAAEMYKMNNFYTYILIGAGIVVLIIVAIVLICSCKWRFETKKKPCNCPLFCFNSCAKRRRRRKQESSSVNVFEQSETGHTWSPVNLPPERDAEAINSPPDSPKKSRLCMNFCLSDPVQDCCEFFDCDIMWRKSSIYTIPIFGRKKQQYFQRRPTRPAPPPPKAVVLPQVKYPDPIVMDDSECEPVPEAPPSPEPVRVIPPKAMYVDPLAFLQKPFLKSIQKEPEEVEQPEKEEAIYSKFKSIVLSKVKKSSSLASINKLGISSDPNGVSYAPEGLQGSSKKLKTASLASLSNIGESELDGNYGSKRSLSLASLQMHDQQNIGNLDIVNDPRSRISVISSATADDIPPSARKDEYIDLEEMSRRMEAKLQAAKKLEAARLEEERAITPQNATSTLPKTYTPNFIPASAFPKTLSSFDPNSPVSPQYYPPVPASQGKPAVPARTSVGSPIYSMSPTGTLGRAKPVVPPRPPAVEMGKAPHHSITQSPSCSPRANSLPRSPRLMKPSGPPPPPPTDKGPIESAI